MVEPSGSGRCINCKASSSICETDKDAGTESAWCLDCAPARYDGEVAHCRAVNGFIERWGLGLEARKADGRPMPSWRVAASSAFHAGVKFARGEQASASTNPSNVADASLTPPCVEQVEE